MEQLKELLTNTPSVRKLIAALVGVTRAVDTHSWLAGEETETAVLRGIAGISDVESAPTLAAALEKERSRMLRECLVCPHPCGRNSEYDASALLMDPQLEIKLQLLHCAEKAVHSSDWTAAAHEERLDLLNLVYDILFAVGEDCDAEYLLPLLHRAEAVSERL